MAIKEASGNIERAARLIKEAPKGFCVYSGDDGSAIALMLLGIPPLLAGTYAGIANVDPKVTDAARSDHEDVHGVPLE